ncbi:hypothetical protein [Devosia ginsengisoli]
MIQEANVHGISTGSVDDLVRAGLECYLQSRVTQLCEDIGS